MGENPGFFPPSFKTIFLSLKAKTNGVVCCDWAFAGRMNTDQLQIFLREPRQTIPSWILRFKSEDVKGSFVLLLS